MLRIDQSARLIRQLWQIGHSSGSTAVPHAQQRITLEGPAAESPSPAIGVGLATSAVLTKPNMENAAMTKTAQSID